jgi:hypothetical protein
MKKSILCVFLFSLVFPLFSVDFALTDLEKRVIKANPQEMASLVRNRGLERQFLAIFTRYEETEELEDIYPTFLKENPAANEADLQFMILKVGMIAALGSGQFDTVMEGLELVGFLKEFDTLLAEIEDQGIDSEELSMAKNSRYWKDCINFANSFDLEAFMGQRFPDY